MSELIDYCVIDTRCPHCSKAAPFVASDENNSEDNRYIACATPEKRDSFRLVKCVQCGKHVHTKTHDMGNHELHYYGAGLFNWQTD